MQIYSYVHTARVHQGRWEMGICDWWGKLDEVHEVLENEVVKNGYEGKGEGREVVRLRHPI